MISILSRTISPSVHKGPKAAYRSCLRRLRAKFTMSSTQTPAKDRRYSKFREAFNRPNDFRLDEGPGTVASKLGAVVGIATELETSTTCIDLKAVRSETWPWSEKPPLESSIKQGVSTLRRESYVHIMQKASQRGFAPPPHHEIHEYEKKALPSVPESSRASDTSSFRTSTRASSKRIDSGMALEIQPSYVLQDRVDVLSEELNRHSKNPIIAERKPTWLSRVESRAENNQLCRNLLMKPD